MFSFENEKQDDGNQDHGEGDAAKDQPGLGWTRRLTGDAGEGVEVKGHAGEVEIVLRTALRFGIGIFGRGLGFGLL